MIMAYQRTVQHNTAQLLQVCVSLLLSQQYVGHPNTACYVCLHPTSARESNRRSAWAWSSQASACWALTTVTTVCTKKYLFAHVYSRTCVQEAEHVGQELIGKRMLGADDGGG